MTKVKICGLKRETDIEYVNILKPDYIGFVFAEKSRRYIPFEKAKRLSQALKEEIAPVGVFVDEDIRNIVRLADENTIELIQLHGNENEEYIKNLRKYTDKKIIKAFGILTEEDIKRAMETPADYALLDNRRGGTGEAFDWSLIKDIHRPMFLAGGLSPGNVREAVKRFSPFALDASSGVETDGVKDFEKIRSFIRNVREI